MGLLFLSLGWGGLFEGIERAKREKEGTLVYMIDFSPSAFQGVLVKDCFSFPFFFVLFLLLSPYIGGLLYST